MCGRRHIEPDFKQISSVPEEAGKQPPARQSGNKLQGSSISTALVGQAFCSRLGALVGKHCCALLF